MFIFVSFFFDCLYAKNLCKYDEARYKDQLVFCLLEVLKMWQKDGLEN